MIRRVSKNLQGGEGLFRRLETTSNDFDPDFDRSLLKLSRFFCPNLGNLKKKVISQAGNPVFQVKITSGP